MFFFCSLSHTSIQTFFLTRILSVPRKALELFFSVGLVHKSVGGLFIFLGNQIAESVRGVREGQVLGMALSGMGMSLASSLQALQ